MIPITTESVLIGALLVGALASSFDFTKIPAGADSSARVVAFVAMVGVCVTWIGCTSHVALAAAASKATIGAERLRSALAKYPAECARAGVTQDWYDAVRVVLSRVATSGVIGIALVLVMAIYMSLPSSLANVVGNALQSAWEGLLDAYSPETLVIGGIFGSFVVVYWTVCVCFVTLDLLRPASLMPFKVDPNFVLTLPALAKIAAVALCNQGLVLLSAVVLQAYVFPTVVPDMLARPLPGLLTVAMHIAGSAALAEVVFYSTHWLMHHSDWLWSHVHYMHHEWHAPIACCCIYAHPIEFMMGNIPVVMMGPLLLGSHISVWALWVVLSVADTCIVHSGWHIPLLPSPEGHDYHHSSGFIDNLGVTGLLDACFGTDLHWDKSWQRGVDKTYGTHADYPVDRILATASWPPEELEQKGLAKVVDI